MNFNPSAFINPTSKAECIALLDEALRMVDDLGEQWDQIFDEIEGEEKMTTETILTDERIQTLMEYFDGVPINIFARAVEQAVLQSPEIQALRKDAGRYRWLRASGEQFDDLPVLDSRGHLMPDALDNEIDAAMEQQT